MSAGYFLAAKGRAEQTPIKPTVELAASATVTPTLTSSPTHTTTASPTVTATDTSTPTATATETATEVPTWPKELIVVTATPTLVVPTTSGEFLEIPKIGMSSQEVTTGGFFTPTPLPSPVQGGLAVKNQANDLTMQSPSGPGDVLGYDFSGKGVGEPLFFAGHVDYVNYGPAVFSRLNELERWDKIFVWKNQVRQTFEVQKSEVVDADTLDVGVMLSRYSGLETLTLITCTGKLVAGEYKQRLIVHAVLVSEESN